jgi:hypothetical protein|tara:strand:+ start:567 stop:1280 length:714 start_codon:yes stop_codon:yes gene_type:complete
MKQCIIKQPSGIGDIFFLQKIAHVYREKGYEIIWPVRDDIFWISEYIDGVSWYKVSDDYPHKELYQYAGFVETDEVVFIDCLDADRTHSDGRIMSSKYSIAGLDYSDWDKYFKFNRKRDKEDALYYDVLKLKDDSVYAYINDLFHTDVRKSDLIGDVCYDMEIVRNQVIDGYTVFDWCKVLENASKIHMVGTSISYIIDVLDLKITDPDDYVYHTRSEFIFNEVNYLFKKPMRMIWK